MVPLTDPQRVGRLLVDITEETVSLFHSLVSEPSGNESDQSENMSELLESR